MCVILSLLISSDFLCITRYQSGCDSRVLIFGLGLFFSWWQLAFWSVSAPLHIYRCFVFMHWYLPCSQVLEPYRPAFCVGPVVDRLLNTLHMVFCADRLPPSTGALLPSVDVLCQRSDILLPSLC